MSFKSLSTSKLNDASNLQIKTSFMALENNSIKGDNISYNNDQQQSLLDIKKKYFMKMNVQQQNQKIGELDYFDVPQSSQHTFHADYQDTNHKIKEDQTENITDILDCTFRNESTEKKESPNQQLNILSVSQDFTPSCKESEVSLFKLNSHRQQQFGQFKQQKGRKQSMWVTNIANMEETNCKQSNFNEPKRKMTQIEYVEPLAAVKEVNPKITWRKRWMEIFYLIHRLKKKVMQTSIFFRPHLLNKMQVVLIGDIGSNFKYTQTSQNQGKYELGEQFQYWQFSKYVTYRNYRKIVKFIVRYFGWLFFMIPKIQVFYYAILQTIFQYLPLFHYLSGFYILWETIMFLSTALLFLYIPFEYSFEIDRSYFFNQFISFVCPVIYGIDIFIRANTRSTENGGFIDNHIVIFHKYLKSDMIPDIVSLLSLNYQLLNNHYSYFLFFIRITKSFRVIDLFREQFLLKIKISGIISLLILLAQLLYFAHIVCCTWYGLGKYESKFNEGWTLKYDIGDQPIEVQYLRSFYYSVITMTTIGYGDITPQTDYEKIIVIFIAFISCGVFGYSINSIGNILSDFKLRNDLYLQEIAKINKYFKQYKVDLDLQARSRQYLDLIYSDKNSENISSIDTLSNLSEYLQNEIKVNVFMRRMKEVKFFKDLFSDQILEQIALKMSEKIYSPEQNIIDTNIKQEPTLYIVHSGAVQKYATRSENGLIKQIKTLYEGQIFGFDAFVQGSYESDFYYKSHGISSIIQVSLSQFLEILKKVPEEYEKFIYVRDQLIHNQNYGVTNLSCDSCWQRFHSLQSCPFIFYSGKKDMILRSYFKNIEDKIKTFKRKLPKICFNSVFNQKEIQKSIEIYNTNQMENSYHESNSNFEDEEQPEENEGQLFDKQSSNRDENSNQRPLERISHKEINTSFKQIYYDDSFNNLITNSTKPDRLQHRFLQFQQSITPTKLNINEEGYTIVDGILQNSAKAGPFNTQNYHDSQRQISITDIYNNKQDFEFIDSLKNINQPKNSKKQDYQNQQSLLMNQFRRLSSQNDSISLSKKLEMNEQRNSLQKQDSREKRNSKHLQNFVTQQLSQFEKYQDKSLSHNIQSDNRTTVVDKSNLSQMVQVIPPSGQDIGNQLFYYSFEAAKIYQYYFPNQNYEQIIEKMNSKLQVINKLSRQNLSPKKQAKPKKCQ